MRTLIVNKFLLFTISLFLFSCQNDITLRYEDRMNGEWIFEKVSFLEQGDIFSENVTENFNNVVITFFDDNTMIYADDSGTYEGEWNLKLDNSSEESEFELIAFLLEVNSGEKKSIVWDNVRIFNNVIRGDEYFDNGNRFRYKMVVF